MSAAGIEPSRSGLWTSLASLFASSSTLICCAIPALLVALGAGAALGREFLDRSVHDSRALQNEFEVPVLGEIPRIA